MTTRVYVPVPPPVLAELVRSGSVPAAGLAGYAVTAAVRQADPQGDDEELEYRAYQQAVQAAADPKVVVAADVERLTDGPAGAQVVLGEDLSLASVAAFHAQDPHTPEDPRLGWYDVTEAAAVAELAAWNDRQATSGQRRQE